MGETRGIIKWADGLRGLAAIFVFCSHVYLAYGIHALGTLPSAGTPIRWFQLPILNLPFLGVPWINVFMVLTGFVNSAGPLNKSRSGDLDSALSGLSSSAFRRTLRLVLPCTIVTTMTWLLCQLHGFEMARTVDSGWLQSTSPAPSASLSAAVVGLFTAIWTTWNNGDNYYDKNQWTMVQFLQGSFLLFLALLATMKAAPLRRNVLFGMFYGYYWYLYDTRMIGLGIFAGALLSDLHIYLNSPAWTPASKPSLRLRILLYPMPSLAIIIGLTFMSYPEPSPSSYPWARSLVALGPYLTPAGANLRWYYHALGPQILILGIIFSPTAQRILSHRYLVTLGAMSFPIYLLHGPLLRSFGTWVLYIGMAPGANGRLPMPSSLRVWLTAPIFWGVTLALAYYWTMHVEPWCGRVTKWLEAWMVGPKEEKIPLASMADVEERV